MTLWPNPLEHFNTFRDVEKFLQLSFTEINDKMSEIEKNMSAVDDGVTYEWVQEHIGEKVNELLAKIDELELRIKELENNE
tara:strand:+ start:2918 stop:3160 length:243 start_codon:yes stop_codon:yes gene_type:complete